MADTSLTDMTVAELGTRIKAKDVSPVEVAEAFIERTAATEPLLNAWITQLPEQSRAAAKQAEAEITAGNYKGPLHGIPVGLKDLFWTKGVRTTSGSAITKDFVPSEDATVVAKLQDAGAYAFGKTNMVEYAYGGSEHNEIYGAPKNPWGLEHVTGGSSSGSGAAVAAGQVPIALGSDTAGSVRAPAALCGLTGHKPTYGLISRFGVSPLSWSMDHVGPLAHTAEDVAIAMNVMVGYDAKDPGSANHASEDYLAALRGDLSGLRVGVLQDDFIWEVTVPEVKAAFDDAVAQISALGAATEAVSIGDLERLAAAQFTITTAEANTYHHEMIQRAPELYHPVVRRRIEAGFFMPAAAYVQAQRVRALFEERYASLFETFDLLIAPTTPSPAPEANGQGIRLPNGEMPSRETVRLTRVFNPNGLPAITMPTGFSEQGLPMAAQFVGKRFSDGLVIGAAHAYQQATDWHTRRPSL
jgi:aspartyl-tRNA(Asn)/glutamyl-tRNA(Gln) amidotransferase subunit A